MKPGSISYPDEGCELHPSCLACPRAVCQYDDPPKPRGARHDKEKYAQIAAMKGAPLAQIAIATGASLRTVYRAMKDARG